MFNLRLVDSEALRYQYEGMIYLPDVVIYRIDEETYKQYWRTLKEQPKRKLYTDGIEVYRVSRFQYLFQSFKGWLNRVFDGLIEFDNHCDPHKVEITLAKIAYYGYLKGFNQDELVNSNSPLDEKFQELVCQTRSDSNSHELQDLLMNYYFNNREHFPTPFTPVRGKYPFGQTFVNQGHSFLVSALDPQDIELINGAIQNLKCTLPANELNYLKSSQFAELYAQNLVDNNRLHSALTWSEHIATKNKEIYIYFYFSLKKQSNNESEQDVFTKKAVQLLDGFSKEIPTKTAEIIINKLSVDDQIKYFAELPKLKSLMAQTYFAMALAEKNKYTVVKWLVGTNLFPILEKAVRLDPQILDKDETLKGITLKEEWISYRFNEAIKGKRLFEARGLYEVHPTFKLDKNNLKILREDYFKEFNLKKLEIPRALSISDLKLAEKTAKEINELAIKIDRIDPVNKTLLEATIIHANTLLKIDVAEHADVKKANLNILNTAQNLLAPLHLTLKDQALLKNVSTAILARKIDCCVENLRINCTQHINNNWRAREEYAEDHKATIDELKVSLNRYIELNKNSKIPEERHALGKMYYLLGDIIVFSTGNKQEAKPHFYLAHKTMPQNPYYHLRYLEMTGSEHNQDERAKARAKIENLGTMHGENYDLYMGERWDIERVQDKKVNIHPAPKEEEGFLSSLQRKIFSLS